MKIKKRVVITAVIVLFAIILAFYFDDSLIRLVSLIRNNVLDSLFIIVNYLSSEIIIFAILTALFLWKGDKKRWIFPLWLTLGVSALVSFLLKVTIQRLRPFQQNLISLLPMLQQANFSSWNFSFPSSHAVIAFSVIPLLSHYPKLKKVWIAVAVVIALSRVYLGLHFFSDVIAGGAIGYIIGLGIMKLEKEYKFGKRIYDAIRKR